MQKVQHDGKEKSTSIIYRSIITQSAIHVTFTEVLYVTSISPSWRRQKQMTSLWQYQTLISINIVNRIVLGLKSMERDTHLFSAASMLMASMMFLTFSVICLALIVCCSNFVFTADCEIHSCEAITHKLLWRLQGLLVDRAHGFARYQGRTEDKIHTCYFNLGEGKKWKPRCENDSSRVCTLCPTAHIYREVTVTCWWSLSEIIKTHQVCTIKNAEKERKNML